MQPSRDSQSAAEAMIIILLRLWALTFAIMVAPQVFATLFSFESVLNQIEYGGGPGDDVSGWVTQLLQGLWAPICVLIWFTAAPLARIVTRGVRRETLQISLDANQLLAVGAALIGLYVAVLQVPRLTIELGEVLLFMTAGTEAPAQAPPPSISNYTLIAFLVGVAVFLSAFRIGALAKYLRSAGLPKD